jgi:hypothetical protein
VSIVRGDLVISDDFHFWDHRVPNMRVTATGETRVRVLSAYDAGLGWRDRLRGRWVVGCAKHKLGKFCGSESEARDAAVVPEQWCSSCRHRARTPTTWA